MKCTSCKNQDSKHEMGSKQGADGKHGIIIMIIVIICVMLINLVDGIIRPTYGIKSAIKVMLYGGIPVIYGFINRELNLKSLFSFSSGRKAIKEAVLWGTGIFVLIVGAYMVLGGFFDFSGITANMEEEMGINKNNFVFVAIYISFANSLLEEFFFRGFACLKLKKYVSRRTAYCFSATLFALYHVAMMLVAFEFKLVVLSFVGLIVGGLIFNYFNEKYENIYISWLIHMGANFAINGIAMSLYGII